MHQWHPSRVPVEPVEEWHPSRVEVDAAEATLHEAFDDGTGSPRPDGYYRPLVEALLTNVHTAWEALKLAQRPALPVMTYARAARMIGDGEPFSAAQLDELRKLDGVTSVDSIPAGGGAYVLSMSMSVDLRA